MMEDNIKLTATSKLKWSNIVFKGYPFLVLAAVLIFFGILSGGSLFSQRSLKLIAEQSFQLLIASMASLFLIAQGQYDFSTGSIIGLTSILAAYCSRTSIVLAVIVALLVGTLVGALNGAIYAKFPIPVLFLTLCVNSVITGVLGPISGNTAISAPFSIIALDNFTIKAVIFVCYCVIFGILYQKTRLGKYSRAIGAGATVVEQSGVKDKRYKLLAFLFTGFTAGLIGFFALCKTGAANKTMGGMFHFDVLVAMTLGGAAMGGPKVKFHCAIVGPLIITLLNSGMNLAEVPVTAQSILKGLMFLIVIVVTHKFSDAVTE